MNARIYRLPSSLQAAMAEKAGKLHLKLDPVNKIVFKSKELIEEPSLVELKITNTIKKRQAFKVKCTSNEIFRIRSPVGRRPQARRQEGEKIIKASITKSAMGMAFL